MTMDVPPGQADVSADLGVDVDSALWFVVGRAADVEKRKKVVVDVDGLQILVLAHDGRFFAFDNICIHRERELSKGVILNGKLVCPGHQWAFALDSGWEAIKQVCQPVHAVRVVGDDVVVCRTATAPSPAE